MGLPWVRLDTGIAHHDKIAALIQRRDGWRAIAVYTFSLAWSGGQGTDGHVPEHAIYVLHGTPKVAETLVEVGLWDVDDRGGWSIHNFAQRQELAAVTEQREKVRRLSSLKANCTRWHGKDCQCWKDAGGQSA